MVRFLASVLALCMLLSLVAAQSRHTHYESGATKICRYISTISTISTLSTHCLAVAMAAASSPTQSWPGGGEVRQATRSFLSFMWITTN